MLTLTLVSTGWPGSAKDLSFSIPQPLGLPAREAMPGFCEGAGNRA